MAQATKRDMIEVTMTVRIDPELIDDTMSSALDWINYWCEGAKPVKWIEGTEYTSEQLTHGGEIEIREDTGEDFITKHTLTLERFMQGFFMWAVNHPAEDIDCEQADLIVQYALFGEARYG